MADQPDSFLRRRRTVRRRARCDRFHQRRAVSHSDGQRRHRDAVRGRRRSEPHAERDVLRRPGIRRQLLPAARLCVPRILRAGAGRSGVHVPATVQRPRSGVHARTLHLGRVREQLVRQLSRTAGRQSGMAARCHRRRRRANRSVRRCVPGQFGWNAQLELDRRRTRSEPLRSVLAAVQRSLRARNQLPLLSSDFALMRGRKVMNVLRTGAAAVSAALLAACGANSGGVPITSVNPTSPSYAKLQFAVGTANIYGTATGLNVVSTLRQPAGESAIGVSTPSITGPFSFSGAAAAPANGTLSDPYTTIPNSGPSLPETTASTPSITGTQQTIHPGTPFCDGTGTLPAGFTPCPSGFSPDATTFGQSGGVFAMGLAPYNAVAEQGQAYAYAPYVEPLYDNGTAHPLFLPWGGPPAFDPDGNGMGTRDGLVPLGGDSFGNPYFLGVAEGITAFEGVAAGSGTYTLNVSVATVGNGGAVTVNTIA